MTKAHEQKMRMAQAARRVRHEIAGETNVDAFVYARQMERVRELFPLSTGEERHAALLLEHYDWEEAR
jgi:hypothetical protein